MVKTRENLVSFPPFTCTSLSLDLLQLSVDVENFRMLRVADAAELLVAWLRRIASVTAKRLSYELPSCP